MSILHRHFNQPMIDKKAPAKCAGCGTGIEKGNLCNACTYRIIGGAR